MLLSRLKSGFKIVGVSVRSYYASSSSNNNNIRCLSLALKTIVVSVSIANISNCSSRSSVRLASRRRRPHTLPPTAMRPQSKTNRKSTSPRRRRRRRHLVSMLRRWTGVRAATAASGTASRGRAASRATTRSIIDTGRQLMAVCGSGQEDVQWTSSTLDVQVISPTATGTLATVAVLTTHRQSSRLHYGTSMYATGILRSTRSGLLVPCPVKRPVDLIDDRNYAVYWYRHQFLVSDWRLLKLTKCVGLRAERNRRPKISLRYNKSILFYRIQVQYI